MSNKFSKNIRVLIKLLGIILAGAAVAYFFKNQIFRSFYAPTKTVSWFKGIESGRVLYFF